MKRQWPLLILFLALTATAAYAQSAHLPMMAAPAPANQAAAAVPAATPSAAAATTPSGSADGENIFRGSFFLTPLEIAAIEQALHGNVIKSQALAAANAPVPAHRVIRLSGVYYRSPHDWVVWMNGQKVTPKSLLPQIVSIRVSPSSRIWLKWYDAGLNEVLSLTMHPDQTYDITTGIMLPGAH